MAKTPLQHFTPDRTPDGEGGFFVSLVDAGILFADPVAHEGKTALACRAEERVAIGDVVRIPYESSRLL